jgi:hypothetical protein
MKAQSGDSGIFVGRTVRAALPTKIPEKPFFHFFLQVLVFDLALDVVGFLPST